MKQKEKKLRILAAGDLHGSQDIAERLAKKAKKKKVDLVILAGDLHGAVEGDGGIVEPFKKARKKVLFVPGNWDSSLEVDLLRNIHNVKNLDGYYFNYKGVDIIGVGNPDFKLNLEDEKVWERLKNNFEKVRAKKGRKILVSHLHASGTKAELSGIRGSEVLRKAISKFKPDILIQGHIHEAEGIEEKIGKTQVVNVGRRGRIIEV